MAAFVPAVPAAPQHFSSPATTPRRPRLPSTAPPTRRATLADADADASRDATTPVESPAPVESPTPAPALPESSAALLKAALEGDVKSIESLLAADSADATAADENGRTALHFAAALGIPSSCALLMDYGADVNLQDSGGLTPLHMAAGYVRPATVQLLLERGAEVEVRTPEEEGARTPLDIVKGLLEREPEKRFFMPNERHGKLKEVMAALEVAGKVRKEVEKKI